MKTIRSRLFALGHALLLALPSPPLGPRSRRHPADAARQIPEPLKAAGSMGDMGRYPSGTSPPDALFGREQALVLLAVPPGFAREPGRRAVRHGGDGLPRNMGAPARRIRRVAGGSQGEWRARRRHRARVEPSIHLEAGTFHLDGALSLERHRRRASPCRARSASSCSSSMASPSRRRRGMRMALSGPAMRGAATRGGGQEFPFAQGLRAARGWHPAVAAHGSRAERFREKPGGSDRRHPSRGLETRVRRRPHPGRHR